MLSKIEYKVKRLWSMTIAFLRNTLEREIMVMEEAGDSPRGEGRRASGLGGRPDAERAAGEAAIGRRADSAEAAGALP